MAQVEKDKSEILDPKQVQNNKFKYQIVIPAQAGIRLPPVVASHRRSRGVAIRIAMAY